MSACLESAPNRDRLAAVSLYSSQRLIVNREFGEERGRLPRKFSTAKSYKRSPPCAVTSVCRCHCHRTAAIQLQNARHPDREWYSTAVRQPRDSCKYCSEGQVMAYEYAPCAHVGARTNSSLLPSQCSIRLSRIQLQSVLRV